MNEYRLAYPLGDLDSQSQAESRHRREGDMGEIVFLPIRKIQFEKTSEET